MHSSMCQRRFADTQLHLLAAQLESRETQRIAARKEAVEKALSSTADCSSSVDPVGCKKAHSQVRCNVYLLVGGRASFPYGVLASLTAYCHSMHYHAYVLLEILEHLCVLCLSLLLFWGQIAWRASQDKYERAALTDIVNEDHDKDYRDVADVAMTQTRVRSTSSARGRERDR